VGSEVVGTDVVGSEVVGAEVVGAEVGSEVAGAWLGRAVGPWVGDGAGSRVGDPVGRGTRRTQICFAPWLMPCEDIVPNNGFHFTVLTCDKPLLLPATLM